jgi:hypothetical protein
MELIEIQVVGIIVLLLAHGFIIVRNRLLS